LNLAKKGVDVIVTYHSNAEEVTKVVAQIELIGAKAVALQLNTGNTKTFDKVTFDERNMSPKLLGQVGGRCFQQRILYLNRIILSKPAIAKGEKSNNFPNNYKLENLHCTIRFLNNNRAYRYRTQSAHRTFRSTVITSDIFLSLFSNKL
jgi:hypothetical protein